MKNYITLGLLLLSGCATHPSFIESDGVSKQYTFENCTTTYQDLLLSYDKYTDYYDKQEIAFTGDFIFVSLIGIPLMIDYEEELTESLNKYQTIKDIYKNNCEK